MTDQRLYGGGLTSDNGDRFSPIVWGGAPLSEARQALVDAALIENEKWYSGTVIADDGVTDGYGAAWDTGTGSGTLGPLLGDEDGNLVLLTDVADNSEVYVAGGGDAVAPFTIDNANGKSLWFEVQLKLDAIDGVGFIVGLAEAGAADDNLLADNSGQLADKDFIGFHLAITSDAATSAAADALYYDAAGTIPGDIVTVQSDIASLEVDTYVNLAIHYDGMTDELHFVVNNQIEATVDLGTLDDEAKFPFGEKLLPVVGIKAGEAAQKQMTVRRLRALQLFG